MRTVPCRRRKITPARGIRSPARSTRGSVQKLVGSCSDCDSCTLTADGFEPLTEAGTKRPVVNCAADLQHQVGASPRPTHLLRLVHPTIDQEIRRAFRHCCPDAHAGAVSSGVVDKPGALAAEIFVDLVKRMPQFSGCHASGSMTALTLVEMHDLADAIEGLLGIFGLAVPDAPVQPLDLRDDCGLGLLATRFVGGQSACRQLRVLQPHGDVEPICDW